MSLDSYLWRLIEIFLWVFIKLTPGPTVNKYFMLNFVSLQTTQQPQWSPGVNFISFQQEAFTLKKPECVKKDWQLDCLFTLLESSLVKAACRNVDEIDPRLMVCIFFIFTAMLEYGIVIMLNRMGPNLHEVRCRFHQRSLYSFCARRSQKRKKKLRIWLNYYAFGIYACKSCT
jgi:hypothetical protein